MSPPFLAEIGTYASLLYVGFTFTRQLRRYYQVQRFLRFAQRALTIRSPHAKARSAPPPRRNVKRLRSRMARMIHDGRLKIEDVSILNEFIKNYS
jgi:hypothetical protein